MVNEKLGACRKKALFPQLGVIDEKLMLAILAIWLRLIFHRFLDLSQNSNSPTNS